MDLRFAAMLTFVLAWALLSVGASAQSAALQNILRNTHNSPSYGYPSDLTRDIFPKPVHSHNDYWRAVPFFSALAVGAVSVEADVWLYNDTLYVGHDRASLTERRTLETLYVNPILEVLQRQNPPNTFDAESTISGVYDTKPSQTLYLFVDVKSDGAAAWPRVVEALQPLRDAKYLSVVKGGNFIPGPVTVIGTGRTPLNLVAPVGDRDYFFDAPLARLGSPEVKSLTYMVSPVASASLIGAVGHAVGDGDEPFNATQLQRLREQLAVAKERNMMTRYWETPGWPVRKRNAVWRALLNEGVDLLNVDDLEALEEYF